ncbi:ATP-dependent nuclease [Clostridium perfringens]
MKSPYISKVVLKNYRNFKDCTVNLSHKGVVIGENNVGKTNFIRALQLILDPSLSEEKRYLNEEDFFDGLENPIENEEEIIIQIFISNYQENGNMIAQLDDATVNDEGEKKLKITYKYYPIESNNGNKEYGYIIFKGENEENKFTYEDRKYLNIKVIKAIRDVEREINNSRNSPLSKLIKNYCIEREDLNKIADSLAKSGADILELDEIMDIGKNINGSFSNILGLDNGLEVSLKTMNIDPNKILNSMKIMMANREADDVSLGLNNLLYISLMLLLIKDKTIPSFIKSEKYNKLIKYEASDILKKCYFKNEKENYFLKEDISEEEKIDLYKFMDENEPSDGGITILAIEEPEAHLHPTYQRLIYKDVIKRNDNSVILTTHSTHITSIADIKSIVHLHKKNNGETTINTTTDLELTDSELDDLERYIDIKRGEIYLGRGVILVEGIAEEYLIPKFAEIMGKSLDERGIIVCNINCTNFKPYVKLLNKLKIPFAVITDGDFYIKDNDDDKKQFHILNDSYEDSGLSGYLGIENIEKIIKELEIKSEDLPNNINEKYSFFKNIGFFVGNNTLEVDMMVSAAKDKDALKVFCEIFDKLTEGGEKQKANFKKEISCGEYWSCLKKIDGNGIGKGRFAQKFTRKVVQAHIPQYVKDAIEYIVEKVSEI